MKPRLSKIQRCSQDPEASGIRIIFELNFNFKTKPSNSSLIKGILHTCFSSK